MPGRISLRGRRQRGGWITLGPDDAGRRLKEAHCHMLLGINRPRSGGRGARHADAERARAPDPWLGQGQRITMSAPGVAHGRITMSAPGVAHRRTRLGHRIRRSQEPTWCHSSPARQRVSTPTLPLCARPVGCQKSMVAVTSGSSLWRRATMRRRLCPFGCEVPVVWSFVYLALGRVLRRRPHAALAWPSHTGREW